MNRTTGFVVQPNKAVVGANAFAHASGIHQDGVLKARDTYEIMRAEDVGWTTNKIVLGKLSGRNAFKQRLQELGVTMESEGDINAAFARFKELADRKSEIFDEDILALVSDEDGSHVGERFMNFVLAVQPQLAIKERPQARVVFTANGKEVTGESDGNGPVDASLRAISACEERGEMNLFGECDQWITNQESNTVRCACRMRAAWSTASELMPVSWWPRQAYWCAQQFTTGWKVRKGRHLGLLRSV